VDFTLISYLIYKDCK